MRRSTSRSIALASALVCAASVASAQTPRDEVTRMDLIAQAESYRLSGQHDQALDRALRAGAIWMTPSLRLFIAREHELLGHVVEAYASARLCLREGEADPRLPNRTAILDRCRDIAASLAPHVARLVVRVSDPAPPGLTVRVGGLDHRAECWNVPCTVHPGRVVIEAEARGRVPYRREVMLRAAQTTEVPIHLPTVPVTPTYELPGPGAGPWIVMGAGVASLGAAIAFVALRNDAAAIHNARCDSTECNARREEAFGDLQRYNTLSAVSFGVGAAAIVSGALWWLLYPRGAVQRAPATTVGARVTAQGDMLLTVGGAL